MKKFNYIKLESNRCYQQCIGRISAHNTVGMDQGNKKQFQNSINVIEMQIEKSLCHRKT